MNYDIHIKSGTNATEVLFYQIKEILSQYTKYYPNVLDWFESIYPEVQQGLRTILIASIADVIVGMTILKHQSNENKICTIWVDPYYRHQGIGTALLDRSLSFFNTDPVLTIPDVILSNFEPWFRKERLILDEIVPNCYRSNSREYFCHVSLLKIRKRKNQNCG